MNWKKIVKYMVIITVICDIMDTISSIFRKRISEDKGMAMTYRVMGKSLPNDLHKRMQIYKTLGI